MSNPHYCHPTPPPPPTHCNPPPVCPPQPPVDCTPHPPHCSPSHHGHHGNWGPLIDVQVGPHDGTHTAGTIAHVGIGTVDVDVGNTPTVGSSADTSLVHADLGSTNVDVGGPHGLITTGPSQATGSLLNVDLDGHGSGTGGTALPLIGSLPAVGQALGAVDTTPAPGGSQASLVHADLGATNVDVVSHDGLITTSSSTGNDAPTHSAAVNVDLDGSATSGGGATDLPVVSNLLSLGNVLGGDSDTSPPAGGSPIHVDLGATDINVGGSAGLITTGTTEAPGTLLNLDLDGSASTGGSSADIPVVGSLLSLGNVLGGDATGGGSGDIPVVGSLLNLGHLLGSDTSGGGTDLPLLGNLLSGTTGGDTGDALLGQILTAPTSVVSDLLGGGSSGGDTCGCDGGPIALPLLGEIGHLDHVLHL